MDASYFRLLFAYNAEANDRVLDAAESLSETQLRAPVGLSHGSIFGTWVFPPPYESPKALYHKLVVPAR